MKCEDFEKLLHLHLDGELDEKKSKELKEHLLSCQRCAEKLQELENLETAVKNIKVSEPSPAYWQIFARKVSNEIILRRRKSLWAKIRSAGESIFVFSPAKLRIAGAVASVLLVFIIGKLYLDYRGAELERIRSERMEKASSTQIQEEAEEPAPATKESLQVKDQKELIISAPAVIPEEELQEEAKEKKEGKGILPPAAISQDAEKPKIEEGVTGNLRMASQAELPTKTSGIRETTIQVQKMPDKKQAFKVAAEQSISLEKTDIGLDAGEGIKYYQVDENWVRALTEKDTLIEVDTLKKVISTWSEFFDKKPESEWLLEGFSQIKVAYHLLFLKSKEESTLDEGIKLLNKYKDSAVEQKTKDDINNKIIGLEALRKK